MAQQFLDREGAAEVIEEFSNLLSVYTREGGNEFAGSYVNDWNVVEDPEGIELPVLVVTLEDGTRFGINLLVDKDDLDVY